MLIKLLWVFTVLNLLHYVGNIVVQSDADELEWDLEPGLDSDSPRHKLKSQSSLEFGMYFVFYVTQFSKCLK